MQMVRWFTPLITPLIMTLIMTLIMHGIVRYAVCARGKSSDGIMRGIGEPLP